jgi:hypothetical protein
MLGLRWAQSSPNVITALSEASSHYRRYRMKKLLALMLAACTVPAAFADPAVSVSIGIQQPGVYGRIDIGRYPQPEVVHARPVVIVPSRVAVVRQPIYLYVPEGHQRNWSRYCNRYNACGQPVYFVKEQWVRDRYRHEHPDHRDRDHRHDHHHDRDRHDDRRDHDRRSDDRGGRRG